MNLLVASLRLPWVIAQNAELLWSFVARELKARVEGSILGRVWPLVQPAILFAIYYLIFSKLLKIGFSDELAPHGPEGEGWRSTFYLITGILPWTCFAECLTRGTGVVLENGNLIKKIAFPSELLPIYSVIVYHVYFLTGFVLLLALQLFVIGTLPVELLWFPVVLLLQFMFIAGMSIFLSAANVFIRDVQQAIPIVVTFWMFTTPVFYDLGAIKAQTGLDDPNYAAIQAGETFMMWNPMARLLDMYRAIFTHGMRDFPLDSLKVFGLMAVTSLVLGYAFFLRSKGRFADEV